MTNIPDNYDQWEAQDIRREMWLAGRPMCEECGNYIQDEEAYHINGAFICEKCMDAKKVTVDDYCDYCD